MANEIIETLSEDIDFNNQHAWVYKQINKELVRTYKFLPDFPPDPIDGARIVCEKSGDLMKCVIELTYEAESTGLTWGDVEEEAIQTAVTAIRFLMAMKNFKTRNMFNSAELKEPKQ